LTRLEVPAPAAQPISRPRLRAGVVGLGRQAVEDHLPALSLSHNAYLAAVCDTDPSKAAIAESYNVPFYDSVDLMLLEQELDFAVVTAPHAAHLAIVESAINARVHVLKEKPFAISLDDARRIARLALAADVRVMTTLQRRFNPIYNAFEQLLPMIGRPYFIDAAYTTVVDEPHAGWRGRRVTAGGGCLLDMGYHLVDLLIWYFGLPDAVSAVTSASATETIGEVEDTASVQLMYRDGPHGMIVVSRRFPPKRERFIVLGTDGVLQVERGRLRRFNNSGAVTEELYRRFGWPSAFVSQVEYFCAVIRGERPNIGSPNHQLAHVATIESCYESAVTGRFVAPASKLEVDDCVQTCTPWWRTDPGRQSK